MKVYDFIKENISEEDVNIVSDLCILLNQKETNTVFMCLFIVIFKKLQTLQLELQKKNTTHVTENEDQKSTVVEEAIERILKNTQAADSQIYGHTLMVVKEELEKIYNNKK